MERTEKKIFLTGVILISIISLIYLATALTDDERSSLESELFGLENELTSQGYDWLINYSVSYPKIEVYEYNSPRLITSFPEITNKGYYKIFLTNLFEDASYSQDVFDLRVKNMGGKAEKIPFEILQKKIRIDEIRKELNIKFTNNDNLMLSIDNKILTVKNGN